MNNSALGWTTIEQTKQLIGAGIDPVNLLSEGCKFYELDIKTMRKKRNNMSYKPTSE